MKKHIFKGIIFLLILAGVAALLSPVLVKKYEYKDDQAAMQIAQGFYAEPENSLDVLYLGSSYIRNGVSPLTIWHEYGITGYSRASSQQAPVASYYLLKETFRTQSPKVVVYEAGMLVSSETSESNDYDIREYKLHEILDYMKWSKEKLELAKEIVDNSSLSYFDLLVPLYRYHERWSDLTQLDFETTRAPKHYAYKGQYPALTIDAFTVREDYMTDGSCDEAAQLDTTTAEYVEKMQALCEEHGAKLVLIRTTNVAWDDNKYQIVSDFAESMGVPYLDYCTQELRTEINFDAGRDTTDQGSHFNIGGARKLSKHLGQYLQENYSLADKRDDPDYAQWDADYETYTYEQYGQEIVKETNLSDYLDLIDRPNYRVYVASKSDTGLYFTDEIYTKMQNLGFTKNLAETFYSSYVGVAQGGNCVYEEMSGDAIDYAEQYGSHSISVHSSARRGSNSSVSIQIDGEDRSKNGEGLNFVVLDTELDRVIDTKSFNTGNTGKLYTARRQFSSSLTLAQFLSRAMTERYFVVLSTKPVDGAGIPEEAQKLLHQYGTAAELTLNDTEPYIAIWDGGEFLCESVGEKGTRLELTDVFGDLSLDIYSSGEACGIWINEASGSMGKYGLNFGVYDKFTGRMAGNYSVTWSRLNQGLETEAATEEALEKVTGAVEKETEEDTETAQDPDTLDN